MDHLFQCSKHFSLEFCKKELHVLPYGTIIGIDTARQCVHLYNHETWKLTLLWHKHPDFKLLDKNRDKTYDILWKERGRPKTKRSDDKIKRWRADVERYTKQISMLEKKLLRAEIKRLSVELNIYMGKQHK